ncbi:MAG: murein biosynthesis integral membrane protein MurJ [Pseudomonadales bacterium]|nr:murein biosynthesis integral membrane protein MurJ [Pseudomonadales bacterium]
MSTGPETTGPGPGQNVARQGSVVSAMTLISRISGFLRDVVLSNFFGAGAIADAFFVAFRIPNFFRRLFAEGAFNQAFVPVLARYREGGREELTTFIRIMSGNLALVLLGVVLAGVLLAPGLITLFAPGFIGDDERFSLATVMVRITFPYLGLISLTAFAGALFNSHHRYAIPAFTPVLLNLSLMSAALFATSLFATPVFALAWGVFFAGVAQLLFQLPGLRRLGLLHLPKVDFRHEGVRRVGRLLVPAIFAASASQINTLIDTMLASTLITGSISWLYYADRLLELPIGLVAVALGTVLLPNLSRLDSSADLAGFRATLDWGIRVGLFLGVPAAVALYVLALPLIAGIFLHGALSVIDARMAALALQAFAVGLLPMVLVKVLAPAFFARQDTMTPFRIARLAIGVNILLNLALFRILGHVGLALATSVSAWVNALLLWRTLAAEGRLELSRTTRIALARCGLAALTMAGGLVWLIPESGQFLTMSVLERGVWLGLAVVGGAAIYVLTHLLTGSRPAELLHRA